MGKVKADFKTNIGEVMKKAPPPHHHVYDAEGTTDMCILLEWFCNDKK